MAENHKEIERVNAALQGQGSINTSVAETWTEALRKVMYSNDSTLAVAYLACLGHTRLS